MDPTQPSIRRARGLHHALTAVMALVLCSAAAPQHPPRMLATASTAQSPQPQPIALELPKHRAAAPSGPRGRLCSGGKATRKMTPSPAPPTDAVQQLLETRLNNAFRAFLSAHAKADRPPFSKLVLTYRVDCGCRLKLEATEVVGASSTQMRKDVERRARIYLGKRLRGGSCSKPPQEMRGQISILAVPRG